MKLAVSRSAHIPLELPHPKAELATRDPDRTVEATLAREIRAWARHASRSNGFCDAIVEEL